MIRGPGGKILRGPGGKPAVSTDCCCDNCPPSCGNPASLCVTGLTWYDAMGIIVGPLTLTIAWDGAKWTGAGSYPAILCGDGSFTVDLECNSELDGDSNPIPCTSKYGIIISLNCCDGGVNQWNYDDLTTIDTFAVITPTSISPLAFNIDGVVRSVGGTEVCTLIAPGTGTVPVRVTATITVC